MLLGYGFPESSFQAGLERRPHLIAVDARSTDPGPYYLGAGVSFSDREAVTHDLRLILTAGRRLGIPVIIGTGGGAGAHPHVTWNVDIIRQIAQEEGLRFRLAVIHADVPKPTLLGALETGDRALRPLSRRHRRDRRAHLMTTNLTDIASVIRSKNAGPYELTLDIDRRIPRPATRATPRGCPRCRSLGDLTRASFGRSRHTCRVRVASPAGSHDQIAIAALQRAIADPGARAALEIAFARS